MVAETPKAPITSTMSETPRQWMVDSGCSNHLSPNRSDFILYTPFPSPHYVRLGDLSLMPSLGEGIVLLKCVINKKVINHKVHSVQYVPCLSYGLLSCKSLNRKGLQVKLEGGGCRVIHPDRTTIAKSPPTFDQLYFLNLSADTIPNDTPLPMPTIALTATLSFDLVHK